MSTSPPTTDLLRALNAGSITVTTRGEDAAKRIALGRLYLDGLAVCRQNGSFPGPFSWTYTLAEKPRG